MQRVFIDASQEQLKRIEARRLTDESLSAFKWLRLSHC